MLDPGGEGGDVPQDDVQSPQQPEEAEDHFKEEEDNLGNNGIHVHGEFKRIVNTCTREEEVRPR